jgi:hypothetical protein
MKSFAIRTVAVGAGAALALSTALLSAPAGAATPAATLPTSSISGTPAKFTPTSLKATAKLPTGDACASKYASFEFVNKEKAAEKFTLSGTGLTSGSGSLPAGYGEYVCLPKGYTGTVKVKLKTTSKVLTVKF